VHRLAYINRGGNLREFENFDDILRDQIIVLDKKLEPLHSVVAKYECEVGKGLGSERTNHRCL
jgi:hypothetical protein